MIYITHMLYIDCWKLCKDLKRRMGERPYFMYYIYVIYITHMLHSDCWKLCKDLKRRMGVR